MDLVITIQEPEFSEVAHGKKVVVVEFPNCKSTTTGRSFKWLPTYDQMIDILSALAKIEGESWAKPPQL